MKVIARIKGGLGNQLFCYAAARRLAVANSAELVIDDITGFVRDREYRRKYSLDVFSIPARKASAAERMEPLERIRRGIAKLMSSGKPFEGRRYLSQQGQDFDDRLLRLRLRQHVYLDGLWQGEGYFKDIEDTIRRDLVFQAPKDSENRRMAARLENPSAVSMHVRCFETAQGERINNLTDRYYRNAIEKMESLTPKAHYFVFSDRPKDIGGTIGLPDNRYTIISQNMGDVNAYADMWLMARCSKHIIANSTFSWWGAWLSISPEKVVICPGADNAMPNWSFRGLLPDEWIKIGRDS